MAKVTRLFQEAERKAKARDAEIEKNQVEQVTGLTQEQREQLLKDLNDLTGEQYFIGKRKKQSDRVKFAQLIMENVNFLTEIGYLTDAECGFLFKLSGYLDFKTNVLVQDIESDVLVPATPSYIAEKFKKTRTSVSTTMNKLVKKGILAVAETGITDEEDRVCTSRTWFVNPNIICCAPKDQIDTATKLIFQKALRNIKVGSKKYNLPIYLF